MPLMGSKKFKVLNKSVPRIDGFDKVTGKAKYAADVYFPDMIYGGMLRSGKSSAKVVSIDTSKAKAMPGIHAVVTAKDMPNSKSWAGYMYVTDIVRYQGDVVAFVAAETKELVQDALKVIEVEYEDLPGVYSIDEALEDGSSLVHEEYDKNIFKDSYYPIRKGNIEEGLKKADIIVEREYRTQYVEHSYIEPEAVVAVQDNEGVMTAYASAQNPFFTRRYIADAIQAPLNRVRIIQQNLGGSFGGKEEAVGLITGRAAYLCKLTGRPVKIVLTREESFLESPKRHPFRIRYKAGVTKAGKIIALEGELVDNSGAYNNQTQYMNCRASVHSAGPYIIENVKTDTYGVFTNNIHSGAMRGYSSPSLIFAHEQFIEEIGEQLNIDPVEIRRINCLKDGSLTATSQKIEPVLLEEIMDHTIEETNYLKKREAYKDQTGSKRKGIGLAITYRGCGLGAEQPDASGAMVIANEDGTVQVNTGLAENGQGLKTAFAQIAAEILSIPVEDIKIYGTDSHTIPDGGMTVASRGTVMGSQSTRKAALKLKDIILNNAAGIMGVSKEDLELEDGIIYSKKDSSNKKTFKEICNICLWTGKQLAAFDWNEPDELIQDHHTGQGDAFPNYAYGCVVAEVEVDMETGYVDLMECVASHDVGTVVNPALASGQIYGGIAMGQGYGIMEEVEVDKGRVRTKNFDSYIIPTAMDVPNMKVNLFECDDPKGTFGAKSLGEPATEAVAAAVANAVYNATGRRIRNNPCDLEKVLLGKKLR